MATSFPIKFHTAAKPGVKRKSDNPNGSLLFSIGHQGRYLCCFYRTFTFFIGKTDKTQQFSRTLDLQRLTGLINLPLWEE
jgi:hypothetical protein